MSKGVFTRMKRVRFIKETEFISITSFSGVGPNTPYPVKVTHEQLSEILYQVKRSTLTGGSVDASGLTIGLTGVASPENLWYTSTNNKSGGSRGYAFPNVSDSFMDLGVDPLPPNINSYFANNYSISYGDYPNIPIYEAKNEYAIWHPVMAGTYPSIFGTGLVTGFSNDIVVGSIVDPYNDTQAFPDSFYGFGYSGFSFEGEDEPSAGGTHFYFSFYNTAVYKDIDGSGNPFSPSNEIYLGVEASLTAFIDPEGNFDVFHSRSWETGGGYEEVFNLKLELKDSELLIPMVSRDRPDSASDLVLTATEWWPYAKDSPPTPVWDTDTGLKI